MNLSPPSRSRHRLARAASDGAGFTLVELLVVSGIIALLAGLLLPALTRSRQTAQTLRCVSNLHQLGLAGQMYWDDNGGDAFRYRGAATNGGDLYWFGWLERGPEGQRAFDPAPGALSPYLAGRGVDICPALMPFLPDFKYKARGAAFGYGYNLCLSALALQPPVNIHRLAAPFETVFLADAAQVNTFQLPASPSHPMLEEFYYLSTNTLEATVHFRHRGTANTLCCDGHVAREKPEADSLDLRLPGQTIGRLRPEILAGRLE